MPTMTNATAMWSWTSVSAAMSCQPRHLYCLDMIGNVDNDMDTQDIMEVDHQLTDNTTDWRGMLWGPEIGAATWTPMSAKPIQHQTCLTTLGGWLQGGAGLAVLQAWLLYGCIIICTSWRCSRTLKSSRWATEEAQSCLPKLRAEDAHAPRRRRRQVDVQWSKGDGNCMWRSLAHKRWRALRKALHRQHIENPEYYQMDTNRWANATTLRYIAHQLDVCIWIYEERPGSSRWQHTWTAMARTPAAPCIALAYTGSHYNRLRGGPSGKILLKSLNPSPAAQNPNPDCAPDQEATRTVTSEACQKDRQDKKMAMRQDKQRRSEGGRDKRTPRAPAHQPHPHPTLLWGNRHMPLTLLMLPLMPLEMTSTGQGNLECAPELCKQAGVRPQMAKLNGVSHRDIPTHSAPPGQETLGGNKKGTLMLTLAKPLTGRVRWPPIVEALRDTWSSGGMGIQARLTSLCMANSDGPFVACVA